MSKHDKGAGNVHRLHEHRAAKVEPLDGWTVQTQYGTLRLLDGTDCVRLEDVHSWMCSNGVASASSVRKIFASLLDDAQAVCGGDTDAGHILKSLRLALALNPSMPVFVAKDRCDWYVDRNKCENMRSAQLIRVDSDGRRVVVDGQIERYIPHVTVNKDRNIAVFASGFPELGHVHCEDGTVAGLVYAIAEGAMRVWHGSVDLRTDFLVANERRKEAESDQRYGINWPKDEVLRTLLARLAVSIPVAHELWDWGRVVAVQSDVQVAPKLIDWGQIVGFKMADKNARLTQDQKKALKAEFVRRSAIPGATGVAKAMAKELGGISVSAFNTLKTGADGPGKRERKNQSNGITTVKNGVKVV